MQMKITVKLFASLMEYVPALEAGDSGNDGNDNTLIVTTDANTPLTPLQLLARYKIPAHEVQTMMKNGVFLPPAQHDQPLQDGDVLTVWPTLQGG